MLMARSRHNTEQHQHHQDQAHIPHTICIGKGKAVSLLESTCIMYGHAMNHFDIYQSLSTKYTYRSISIFFAFTRSIVVCGIVPTAVVCDSRKRINKGVKWCTQHNITFKCRKKCEAQKRNRKIAKVYLWFLLLLLLPLSYHGWGLVVVAPVT